MKRNETKSKLFLRLAKDAEFTARRQKRYADEAKAEGKFARKDLAIAKKKNLPSRMVDTKKEIKVINDFVKYRTKASKHYTKVAKIYRKKARGIL